MATIEVERGDSEEQVAWLSVVMPLAEKRRLRVLAAERGTSASAEARRAIRAHLERHGRRTNGASR